MAQSTLSDRLQSAPVASMETPALAARRGSRALRKVCALTDCEFLCVLKIVQKQLDNLGLTKSQTSKKMRRVMDLQQETEESVEDAWEDEEFQLPQEGSKDTPAELPTNGMGNLSKFSALRLVYGQPTRRDLEEACRSKAWTKR
eukprot:2597280-Amphidinium_carterae.1